MTRRVGKREEETADRRSGKGSDDGWKFGRSIKEERGRVAQAASAHDYPAILSLTGLG